LPLAHEEAEPAFVHYDGVPAIERAGASIRLILGDGWGERSPVRTLSPMFYADLRLDRGAAATLPADHDERALYVFDGRVDVGGESFAAGELAVLRAGAEATVGATSAARVLAIGGPALDAPRLVWWNYVSSRAERIREAAADWKAGRYARVPGDADEFIPLPDRGPGGVADYP
jgi:redox-sensitive bicupin YhaK (pirin superfamily)